jgi:hypothetical protein
MNTDLLLDTHLATVIQVTPKVLVSSRPSKGSIHWNSVRLSLLILALISLSGCPSDKTTPDLGTAGNEVGGEIGGYEVAGNVAGSEDGDVCVERNDCARSECADAVICKPCESGGYCLYTGTLKIFGTILSKSGQLISDFSVRAICGDAQVSTVPGEEGRYEFNINANQCN